MEAAEISDARIEASRDKHLEHNNGFGGRGDNCDDPASCEVGILEDLDAYWEDVNVRLTVSRMVSNSVMKGIINAISEDAADKIAAKEAEVSLLTNKLNFHVANADDSGRVKLCKVKARQQMGVLDFGEKLNGIQENLVTANILLEKQLQNLEKGIDTIKVCCSRNTALNLCESSQPGYIMQTCLAMEESFCTLRKILASSTQQVEKICLLSIEHLAEQKWKHDLESHIVAAVMQWHFWEFQYKFHEQNSYNLDGQNKNWALKVNQLWNLRQELDAIAKSLDSPEIGRLQSHGSHDGVEEWTHRKVLGNHNSPVVSCLNENGNGEFRKVEGASSDVMDFSQLKRMTVDGLINYFLSERTKLKRSHESIVQEITEEYFRLKREYLKEKDSYHVKKDKELDALKKKIPKLILHVDNILAENEHPSMSSQHCDKIQNGRLNALIIENQTLQDLLQTKTGEVNSLVSQVSDTANKMSHHSLVEANLLKEVKKLKCDLEEKEMEVFVQEQVCKNFLKELISQVKSNMDLLYIETFNTNETCEVVYREAMLGCVNMVNMMMLKYKEVLEKNEYLENILLENEKTLDLEINEKDKVKQELLLLSSSMKEKEKIASEAGSSLVKQKEHFEQALQEVERLKKQILLQENIFVTNNKELDTAKSKLQDAMEQIGWYKAEMHRVNENLKLAESTLQEVERQKELFYNIIQEKDRSLSLAVANEYEQSKQIKSIILDVQKSSQVMMSFEQWLTEIVGQKSARLDMLVLHFKPLVHRVNELKKKGLLYKQGLERRCLDLQKAEEEVDLLADEVETLLSLLEKIYIALDHYSPVLQHYTGIMEILRLIRRELTRENLKPV